MKKTTAPQQPKIFDLSQYVFKQTEAAKPKERASSTKLPEKGSSKSSSKSSKVVQPAAAKSLTRPERVVKNLQDPAVKIYCLFLQSVLPIFDKANLILQKEEPCIHVLHSTLTDQLKALLTRFVHPSSIRKYQDELHKLPFDRSKHLKDNDDMFIGGEAQRLLVKEKSIDKKLFYDHVRGFYKKAVQYMIDKYPFSDPLLINAKLADVSRRDDVKFESVRYFAERFTCLGMQTAEKLDALQGEFVEYQVDSLSAEITSCPRVDRQWYLFGLLKDRNQNQRYPLLSSLVKALLVVFHSNADCERIFSFVTKTKTQFRASMTTETVQDLTVQKQFMAAVGKKCFEQEHSIELLKRCKGATYTDLSGKKKD